MTASLFGKLSEVINFYANPQTWTHKSKPEMAPYSSSGIVAPEALIDGGRLARSMIRSSQSLGEFICSMQTMLHIDNQMLSDKSGIALDRISELTSNAGLPTPEECRSLAGTFGIGADEFA